MPDKQPLTELLSLYESIWCKPILIFTHQDVMEERHQVDLFRQFLREQEDPFLRTCAPGHFTGSALVVDPGLEYVLLTHHKKLGKWLQLGGHADGDSSLEQVAWKEVREESGLTEISFLDLASLFQIDSQLPIPFDLDCHLIPPKNEDAAHSHFDVRFLIVADKGDKVEVSEESFDVRWFSLSEARKLTDEWSMQRQFLKLEALRQVL